MALPIKVLFVCIHNAGRSQIAAALANYLHAGVLDARSAGLNPDTYVSAVAAKVLAARGLDITGNVPRMLENADLDDADIVITLVRDVEIEVPVGDPRNRSCERPRPLGNSRLAPSGAAGRGGVRRAHPGDSELFHRMQGGLPASK